MVVILVVVIVIVVVVVKDVQGLTFCFYPKLTVARSFLFLHLLLQIRLSCDIPLKKLLYNCSHSTLLLIRQCYYSIDNLLQAMCYIYGSMQFWS